MSLPTAIATVKESVRMRHETDRIMSVLWIFSPLLGIIIFIASVVASIGAGVGTYAYGTGPAFGTFVGGLVLGIIAYAILIVMPWYLLISRRNKHFMRDRTLRDGLINYIKEESVKQGAEEKVTTELATLVAIQSDSNADETEKSAALWIILSIITLGIAGLYVLYFLTRDPQAHDSRQQSFAQQVQSGFSKLGKTVVNPSWKSLPSRSFFLYLILQIITFGIFGIYWYYVLITDFNKHFKAQWQFEDQISSTF